MHLLLAAGFLAAGSVHAFSDSSPFILFSTAQLSSKPSDDQLQTSSQLLSSVKELVSSCPTSHYLLVSQPNIHATDLRGPSGCQAPNLCRALENNQVKAQLTVSERRADKRLSKSRQLQSLPKGTGPADRAEALADNDYELGQWLRAVQASGDYTVIYFSDPNEFQSYQADFVDPVHLELKRQSEPIRLSRRKSNASDNAPLFEKYQFFTPGIFMGFVALFVMLSVLYMGLTALSSLQVSYGAFDKEMGPAAHKKPQ